nr:hypothetical protein CQNTEFLM_CQNTEFLM_CDS_0008 [uncultured phage]
MIKAGINPLIATLGSGGFSGAPSTGSSGSGGSHGYQKDNKQGLAPRDVLAAGSSIAVGLAKILTMLM